MPLPVQTARSVFDQVGQPGQLRGAYPEDAAAGVGSAAAGLGETISAVAKAEKEKADAFAVADLDAKFSREATDLLYNPKTGFLTQQGGNALDSEGVVAALNKARERYAAEAKNPVQQRAFMARSEDRAQSLARQVEVHSAQQRQQYYKDTADGQIANAVVDAATFWNSPEDLTKVVEHIRPVLFMQWASNESLPPEMIQARWSKVRSDIYSAAMEMYVSKDKGIEGLKFLAEHRDDLGPAAYKYERMLKPIQDKQIGDVAAETIYQQAFGKADDDLTGDRADGTSPEGTGDPERPSMTWALKKMRQYATDNKLTLDQFNAMRNGLNSRMDEWAQGFQRDGASLMDSAVSFWNANHDLSAVPENLRQKLLYRGEWYKMESLDRSFKQASAGEPPTEVQMRNMNRFIMDLYVNPHKYDNWTEADFQSNVGWALHRSDREQAARELARFQGRPERWTEGTKPIFEMGIQMGASKEINAFPSLRDPDPKKRDPSTWDEKQQLVFWEFQRRIGQWLRDWHSKPHKTAVPTQEEFRPFLEELFLKGKDPDGGFFGSGTYYLKAATLGTGFTPDETIPPETLRQIKEAWAAKHPGEPEPSEDVMRRAYLQGFTIPGKPEAKSVRVPFASKTRL